MGSNSWSETSKAVGWNEQQVAWPTAEQVKAAIEARSAYRLLTWHRFLPPASNHGEEELVSVIKAALEKVRAQLDP